MPKNTPIQVPSSNAMQWVLKNPAAAAQLVEAVNKLISIQVQFVQAGNLANQKYNLRDTPENYMLPLPLVGPYPWAAPTGTASRETFVTSSVTTAQLAQRMMALTQDLMRIGILPTSS